MSGNALKKVFLITGVSSGLGRSFAEHALAAGHTVIGTVRSEQAKQEFELQSTDRAHSVVIDVADLDAIKGAVDAVTKRTGPVDVLVNNAGYGHEGPLEESSLAELQRQFSVNVFGAVAMMKAVLPSMRQRRRGHIVNVTSLAGHVAFPGVSFYCGSKFALEAISESLAQEVRGFGIHVTALAPGAFRTHWAGRSLVRAERSIADYDAVFEPIRQARRDKDGRQLGNPHQAARVLLDLVERDNPPTHLVLGSDAVSTVKQQLAEASEQLAQWESVSVSTDYA